MITTLAGLIDLLKFGSVEGVTATDPLLLSAKVVLFVNNISPTQNTLAADLVEPSWTGYARSPVVVWNLPIVSNETTSPVLIGDLQTFTCTTQADPAETAFGYALIATISAVDHLLDVQPFLTPITPADATEIGIVPRYGIDPAALTPSGDVAFE